jgi:tetratricopeptide (TPR) repeat protein
MKTVKFLISLITLIISFNVLIAQIKDKTYSKNYYSKLEKANKEFYLGNYHIALPLYNELFALDTNNTEVAYKLGQCIFFVRRESQESFKYFQKAKVDYPASYFYLGRLYHSQQKFDKALEAYLECRNSKENKDVTIEEIDYYMQKSVNAKEILQTKTNATIENFNNGINTPFPEYCTLLSPDENTIYFTSRRKGSTGNKLDANYEYYEDIYYVEKTPSGWGEVKNIGSPINTDLNDATVAISKDGQQMYIFRTAPNLINGMILVTNLENGKWTEPKPIDIPLTDNPQTTVTSLSISQDMNTIYFAADAPGGYGGKDIYRITKMPDGRWSKPMNLGPTINTPYDEESPFIHPDGVTLYFSSKGHKNIGGYDVFKTTKLEDGNWTTPENMGYPINSVMDDLYFISTFDGKTFYLSSNRDEGNGGMDIYKGEIIDPQLNRIILKGTVMTQEPEIAYLKATITIIDYDTKELQGIYRTTNNGKYIMVLLPKKKYKMIVEAENYYPFSTEIDLTERLQFEDFFKTIILKPINKE